jgi:undecaprenyl-diphosphatase
MKKKMEGRLFLGIGMLSVFALWTVLVKTVDVGEIGQGGAAVGFATLNGWFHRLTGVHTELYVLTDLFSIVPLCLVGGFALLGAGQWIRRRSLGAVDRSLILLGIFYLTVFCLFLFFEVAVINCRPILIDGELEASYPSSTTLLSLCVLSTAILQFKERIKGRRLRIAVCVALGALMLFLVIGRTVCGVHWLSDIVGGILLGAGLVLIYDGACRMRK